MSENRRRDKDIAVPRSQLRTALMGATADITRVGAANRPADTTCEESLNDKESHKSSYLGTGNNDWRAR